MKHVNGFAVIATLLASIVMTGSATPLNATADTETVAQTAVVVSVTMTSGGAL